MLIKKNNLLFLDGLRGIAAFYVIVGHARWLLWEGHEAYLVHSSQYTLLDKSLMYFFTLFKFGHEFVLFFFVLSGFVIHLKYVKNLKESNDAKFKWPEYFFKRIKRIYPPFIFALLLTGILDFIGTRLNLKIYYGETSYLLINRNIANADHSITTFLGNLFFLYKQYVPIFGTNGPSWSLKYEWWFYMIYPLFLLLSKKNVVFPTLLLCLLFILSITVPSWPETLLQEIFSGMLAWWLGVLIAEVFIGRITINFIYIIVGCLLASAILRITHNPKLYDFSIALLFSSVLCFFLLLTNKGKSLLFLEKLKPIGDLSYTLYITHFPILVLCSGILLKYNNGILPIHSFYIIAAIPLCLLLAYSFSFLTEKPFVKKNGRKLKVVINN